MANDLKMEVILQAIDRATRPIRAITQGSIGLGQALKKSRDQLKQLQATQNDVSSWQRLRAISANTETALQGARDRVKELGRQMAATGVPTRQMVDDLQAAMRAATDLKRKHQEQQAELQGLRSKLSAAGINTRNLSQHSRELKQRITETNEAIGTQTRRMQALVQQQKRMAAARAQFDKSQQLAGSMAAGGAAGLGTAYAISRPLKGIVDAFAPAENATTQLKVAMMDGAGQVPADFEKISDLATRLGDRLPGTTADFQEMMTMLRRQGMSAQSILGGTGEAAAYLGVQLQKPVADAAEFAAKMQDATRTSEKDMLALMDTIQRAFYLGVDDNNMLQGFTKLSPVMSIIKKEGLEAANTLAPLLVMMDQTGMAGESAGNAIRKVFQSGVDEKRFTKANAALAEMKAGFNLDFTNGKGEFGGLDNLFAQLEKLKKLTSVQRTSVMKELFGDDSETLQVVNTLMSKGLSGYEEVAAKMQAQADLRTRVNEQLGTLTNTIEAAEGSWTNAMGEIGATIAPELKDLINGLGELAVSVKNWVKENPALTAAIVKTAGGLALLLAVGGGITVMLASFLGPFAMVRYALTLFGIKSLGAVTAIKGMGTALLWAGKAVLWLGRALMMNPIGLAVMAIAGAAYLIYKYWDPIKAYFLGLWEEVKAGFNGGFAGIAKLILDFSPLGLFYRAFAGVMNYFGVEMPGKFSEFGTMLMQGMVQGITNGLGAVKGAITGAADSTVTWFKEKLGIHSPSRVFASLGGFTMAGLEQGLVKGQQGPLAAVTNMGKQLVAAGAIGFGTSGGAIAMDNRPPLSANAGGGIVVQGDTIEIKINAAPGTDTDGLRQMLNQLLDERERVKAARIRSRLGDQE
ncbi:TPA: phage tail tape measure protein [Pseudomonas aeruginosa 059A]|nr:phage tail tape measure protein [Pseudomonas aeruginosa 059A]HCL2955122.1 phage tail tape measure protein [Pseudomonas aeruginosa 059A]HCL2967570.1 phage tail tape measure protein [Pseudomonas aeruginosa 059A]HCL2973731.1 phage tail tape measure protein [Pseudomonas aeruginosa 059A]HCL2986536.1 phage tail tape measure protein [Pseudomonas aeruginosa 059A]